jgi:uncharacterized alkaline shock family protein YloU
MFLQKKKVDTKELELPETVYVHDIDNKVFEGIIAQCIGNIKDIALEGGGFMHNILGMIEKTGSITTEQDPTNHSISARIEVRIAYGISIPQKTEEIQTKVAQDLTKMTGLHVSQVHIVFKGLLSDKPDKVESTAQKKEPTLPHAEEYSDVF